MSETAPDTNEAEVRSNSIHKRRSRGNRGSATGKVREVESPSSRITDTDHILPMGKKNQPDTAKGLIPAANESQKLTFTGSTKKKVEADPNLITKDQALIQSENESTAEKEAGESKKQSKLLAEKVEIEQQIASKIGILSEFVSRIKLHKDYRSKASAEELKSSRLKFARNKSNLKTDLKKCTAFIRKVKSAPTLDAATVASLIIDLDTLNLTRYIQEIAQALVENKSRKVTDVTGLTQLCHALHLRYDNWMDEWFPRMHSIVKDKNSDPKLRRIFARVMTEMILFGIGEAKPLLKLLSEAAGSPGSNSGDKYEVTDANMITSIIKTGGFELIGILPRSISIEVEALERIILAHTTRHDDLEEVTLETNLNNRIQPSQDLLQDANEIVHILKGLLNDRAIIFDVSERVRKHLEGSFQFLSELLISNHKRLSKMKQRCAQDRLLCGFLSEQREKALDDAVQLLDSISKSVDVLADALNQPYPTIAEEVDEIKVESGLEVYRPEDGQIDLGPFDDEETKSFYCDIPDLLTTIPPAILGYKDEEVQKLKESNRIKYSVGFDEAQDMHALEDMPTESSKTDPENPDELYESSELSTREKDESKDTPHFKLTVLLDEELPECNRRDKIDILAEKFCTTYGAGIKSRKRLEKALVMIPRSRLDLIPYYSRLSAILDRVFPDVTDALVKELEQQFHGMAKWKKQSNLENRIRNAKFIGELTKFRVAPPIVALGCFSRCLDDFSGHNVDVACALLESCGRFLFKMKHTSNKIVKVMETMDRIRTAKNFDERLTELIKSAFYVARPPTEKYQKKAKVLSPIEDYIKYLFCIRLDLNNVTFVTKQILRLPWNNFDMDCGSLIVKYLLKTCRKGRYKSTAAMADLAAKLKKHKPEVIARLIDSIYEDIQLIMEKPNLRDQQRAISYTKFLGELYSQSLVSTSEIFDQLYLFLNFDHNIPQSLYTASYGDFSVPTLASSLMKKTSLSISQPIQEEEEEEEEKEDQSEEENDDNGSAFRREKGDDAQTPVPVSLHSSFDPRVPSFLDPPYSVFRIKLTCTLLDSCAVNLATAANFNVLNNFLAAFQRYLFVKQLLPTDIEFSLLDTFDILESKLKVSKRGNSKKLSITRYENWIDAHTAVVAIEAIDFNLKERSRSRLLNKSGHTETYIECDEQSLNADVASSDDESDDSSTDSALDADDSVDDSDEFDEEGCDERKNPKEDTPLHEFSVNGGELAASWKEDDDNKADVGSDRDEDVDLVVNDDDSTGQKEYLQKIEDEAFEQELRKLTMEALEKGKISARTAAISKVSDYMPAASQFTRKKEQREFDDPMSNALSLSGHDGISFQLIKRSNRGKAETRNFIVPLDTNLAKVACAKDAAAAQERDILKARVLQYEIESENTHSGDVYLEQPKIKEVRNRKLSNYDIDNEFGRSSVRPMHAGGRGMTSSAGRGSHSGRGLKHF